MPDIRVVEVKRLGGTEVTSPYVEERLKVKSNFAPRILQYA